MNFTKIEADSKSNLSYKNDIAKLDIQPRFLDDVNGYDYTKATEKNDGEIIFQNIYKNSSNLPLSSIYLCILLALTVIV